jgi:uncharacterized protein involved in exopolysaccharide biosynthesis
MTGPVRTDVVLTDIETQMILNFRNANEQVRSHIASLMSRMAEKFPDRQRPALKLIRRSAS